MTRCSAFTLIELLVVLFIIGLLTSLALPAIQSARESGRRAQCLNHLRNQAIAALNMESNHGHFPSGGWGPWWVGVPGRGVGPRQPGGWVYILLPYLERSDLVERSSLPPAELAAFTARVIQTPLAIFNCPTRRPAQAYPLFYDYAAKPYPSDIVPAVARADYAINCGDQPRCEVANYGGPHSIAEGDADFLWPDVSDHTGVSYLRSQVAAAEIRDGLSRTYLIAEKYVRFADYHSGADHGDDWSMYTGYQDDVYRTTYHGPLRDGDEVHNSRFGSAHPRTWNAAFCDGGARPMSYEIDAEVHKSLGNRKDGMIIDDATFLH